VPILVFLGLSVLELGPMYVTDVRRQTDVRQKHPLMPPPYVSRSNSKHLVQNIFVYLPYRNLWRKK